MNQLQAFIYYLIRMDIVMLNDILTEDISYCGVSKKIFLEKLGDVFEHNASLNNENLAVQRSPKNTNCIEFFCWYNGYWENSLLIKEKNGSIISFIRKQKSDSHNPFCFRIYQDEEIGFVKSDDFIMNQNKCKEAIDLIKDKILTTELILNWVREYEDLYEDLCDENNGVSIIENIKFLEEFVELWECRDWDKRLILNYTLAEEALNEYNSIDEKEWIENHLYTYSCKLISGDTLAEFSCDENYRFKHRSDLYESKELYLVHKFTDLYNKRYHDPQNVAASEEEDGFSF